MIAYETTFNQRPIEVGGNNLILVCNHIKISGCGMLVFNHIKIRRCGLIAYATTFHQRPIDVGGNQSDTSM